MKKALAIALMAQMAYAQEAYVKHDLTELPAENYTVGCISGTATTNISRHPRFAFNGAGMNEEGTCHRSDKADSYMFAIAAADPAKPVWPSGGWFVQADLGCVKTIDRVKIFNFNWNGYMQRGFKTCTLYGAVSESDFTGDANRMRSRYAPLKEFVLSQASGKDTYEGEIFDLDEPARVRYLAIYCTEGFQLNQPYGLSEVELYAKERSADFPLPENVRFVVEDGAIKVKGTFHSENAEATAQLGVVVASEGGAETEVLSEAALGSGSEVTLNLGNVLTGAGMVKVFARNSAGSATNTLGAAYAGALRLEKICNGKQDDKTPAKFRISAAGAVPVDLPVRFSFSGTAENGTHFKKTACIATIPAGASFVEVSLEPIVTGGGITTTATVEFDGANHFVDPEASSASMDFEALVLPEGLNFWGYMGEGEGKASDSSNWTLGVTPATDAQDIAVDGRYSNKDILWDVGVNGLPATLPQISFADYTAAVTLDSDTDGGTVTVAPGPTKFAARAIKVGKNRRTVARLEAGAYELDSIILGHMQSARKSVAEICEGAVVKAREINVLQSAIYVSEGYASMVEAKSGSVVELSENFKMGEGENCGSKAVIAGRATFQALEMNSSGSRFEVDGGIVTNKATITANVGTRSGGSTLMVRNGGVFCVPSGNLQCAARGKGAMKIFAESGGLLEVGGKIAMMYKSAGGTATYDLANDYALLSVSNASLKAANIDLPHNLDASNAKFEIVEDEGGSTSVQVTQTINIGCPYSALKKIPATNCVMSVNGGGVAVGAINVGANRNVYPDTGDQKCRLEIGGATANVLVGALQLNGDSKLVFRVPCTPYAAAPLQASGAAKFMDGTRVVVDIGGAKGGTYQLMHAEGGIQGLTADRIDVLPENRRGFARVSLSENKLMVKVLNGMVITIR